MVRQDVYLTLNPRVTTYPAVPSVETTPERTSATNGHGRDRQKAKLEDDDGGAEEEEDTRSRKKGRKGNSATQKGFPSPASSSDRASLIEEFLDPGAIKKWRDCVSWEQHIEMIEAVERTEEGDLFIYFKLHVCRLFVGALSDSSGLLFVGRVRRQCAKNLR